MSGNDHLPWGDYSKASVLPSWTYPMGQRSVEAALREGATEVRWLSLAMPDPRYRPLQLVRARVGGNAEPRYFVRNRGRDLRAAASLIVYAVPAEQAEAARTILLGGALTDAVEWIARSSARGDAWASASHSWHAALDRGRAAFAEG